MKTLQELLQLRAAKVDELSALVDKMNADGYAQLKADDDSYDEIKKDIADLDKAIARKKEADALKASTASVERTIEPGKASVPAVPKRPVSLKNIKGEDAEARAYRAGQFFLASMFGSEKAGAWCKENGILVQKAASEGVNSAGGVLVPAELQSEIIVLRNSYGLARRALNVVPMARDTMTIPKIVSGLTMYFVAEGIAPTQSQVVWTNVGLTAKKASVLTVYSSELDEDAIVNYGDLLSGEIAYAYANGEDNCLFNGDGTSTYGGMTGLRKVFNDGVGVLAGSVDAASGHDTMAEIDANDLAKLQGALPQYVYDRGNPGWICSQTMWANVFERLIGASGGVTKDQASGRTVREYNGYPVEITPAMLAPASNTTDTSDVAMILFGDLNMSVTMGDRRGMTISRSTEYKFAEDQIAIKGTERFDINVHNAGDATTPGSIVALMGE
jgi:HK97 family phage major capsid protein